MKKIIYVLSCLLMAKTGFTQSWNLTLNTVAGNPNFGTINNQPINFYTNNTKQMVLSTTGNLTLLGLSGSSSRFLQVDGTGQLTPWTGSSMNNNKILFGDNSWKVFPFFMDSTTVTMQGAGSKLGIGLTSATTELDVNGGAQIANGLRVGEGLYIGSTNNYGFIHYTPGTSTSPAIFTFGGGGTGHPNNPSPGNAYNPFNGGHGGSYYSPDPSPVNACVVGNPTPNTLNCFVDELSVKKLSSTSTLIGNINLGHNGINAFLETQGTNPSYPTAGDLLLNNLCNRNIYAFSNGASNFASGTDHVMAIAGRLNVAQNMQIGGGTNINNFAYNTAALFVNAPLTTAAAGIRVYHGGGNDGGVKIVELSTSKKALCISNGTSYTNDGPDVFNVFGDGQTAITTANPNAFLINDATNSNALNFKVSTDGSTYIGLGASTIASKVVIGQGNKTQKALSLVDNSNQSSITDFFSVYGNGYTEINVSSPATLPGQVNNIGRVLAIIDKTQSKDIFVIKQNGKVYAREVEISLATTFPDYVFSKNYKLMPLTELENYINNNKRLPGFENADYYEKNGVNVNELMIKQQEKIEELTLYILKLEKRINALEKN